MKGQSKGRTMKRWRLVAATTVGLAAAGMIGTIDGAQGQETAPPPAAAPSHPEAVKCRQQAQAIRKEVESLAAGAKGAAGDRLDAIEALSGAKQKKAEAFEALAKAWDEGTTAQSEGISKEFPRLDARIERCAARLWAIDGAAENSVEPRQLIADTPGPAKPALEAMLEARKALAGAYTKYAQVLASDAAQATVEDTLDELLGAMDDLALAARGRDLAMARSYRRDVWAVYKDAALDQQTQVWDRAYQEVLDALRQQNQLKAKVRKLERAAARSEAERLQLTKRLTDAARSAPAPQSPREQEK